MLLFFVFSFFFFFNDTATTEIYTLPYTTLFRSPPAAPRRRRPIRPSARDRSRSRPGRRSEEHTSELPSLTNIVCRLLLEKKKAKQKPEPVTALQRQQQKEKRKTDTP